MKITALITPPSPMKITHLLAIAASVAGLSLTSSAYASIILGETVESQRTFSITTSASDVTGSTPVAGTGFNAGFKQKGTVLETRYGVKLNSGFADWSASPTEAIAQKTFIDTTLTFNASASYDLTALSYALRRGKDETNTLTFALFTKINEVNFTDTGLSFTMAGGVKNLTERTLDLSGLTALDNIGNGDVLTLRLAIFSSDTNDTSSTLTFGNITNLGTTTNMVSSALILEGTAVLASSIPEPSTGALIGGVFIMTAVVYKRRRKTLAA